jgi:hypothetical protein
MNRRDPIKFISSLSIPLGAIPDYHEIGHTEHVNKMPRYFQAFGTYTGTVSRRSTIDCQLTHLFVQAMNIFVNLFGRAAKFSVKDRKSNLRKWSLTDGSHHDSFHLDFLWKKGRKEDRWFPPEVCSFWWANPARFSG